MSVLAQATKQQPQRRPQPLMPEPRQAAIPHSHRAMIIGISGSVSQVAAVEVGKIRANPIILCLQCPSNSSSSSIRGPSHTMTTMAHPCPTTQGREAIGSNSRRSHPPTEHRSSIMVPARPRGTDLATCRTLTPTSSAAMFTGTPQRITCPQAQVVSVALLVVAVVGVAQEVSYHAWIYQHFTRCCQRTSSTPTTSRWRKIASRNQRKYAPLYSPPSIYMAPGLYHAPSALGSSRSLIATL